MVSKIEQIIEEIEEMIDGCKYATFSSSKILVDKEEIDELLHELKSHTPDEIMRCQKIISNKEAIMADAHSKADALIREAQNFSDQMVSEHEIMQQAYSQADEIVKQAKHQAQEMIDYASEQASNIQMSAMQYTDDSLANIQAILTASIQETQAHNNNLLNSLTAILNVVNSNRLELHPEEQELAMDLAIADRAEAERMMMEAANPAPEGQEAQAASAGGVSSGAGNFDTAEIQPDAEKNDKAAAPKDPGDAPAPRAMGGVIRGGISKSITE